MSPEEIRISGIPGKMELRKGNFAVTLTIVFSGKLWVS